MSVSKRILNIVSYSTDWRARILSNFAHTPFEIDGVRVESVEGFWQGLKFDEGSALRRDAFSSWGRTAKRLGRQAARRDHFTWQGRQMLVGSSDHLELLRRALWAKFTQVAEAKTALMATCGLVLVHQLPHDSKVLPGAVLARLLMAIRATLLKASTEARS